MISLEGLLEKLEKATQTPSGGWKACCPSHEDENPSLTVAVGKDGKILMNCKAGCDFGKVVEALGMKPGDFFPETRSQQRRKTIVQTYDYTDQVGTLLFQKVRFRMHQVIGSGGRGVQMFSTTSQHCSRCPETMTPAIW